MDLACEALDERPDTLFLGMARVVLAFFVAALVLVPLALSSGSASGDIVVTRESPGLPSGCTPREVAQLLVRFTEAVNAGDIAALGRVFAVSDPPGRPAERPETYFRWYSVTEAGFRHTALYDLPDLMAYFRERHRQNERMELIAVDVGLSGTWGSAGIGYTIRRDAADLPLSVSRLAHGKGEIDCAAQRIYVWSMGQDTDDVLATACPLPADWAEGKAIVACSRAGDSSPATGAPNARATVPDFKLTATTAHLPQRCNAQRTARRLRVVLASFNAGRGQEFAAQFSSRGSLHPYTDSLREALVGRRAIAAFARFRYQAGDGWTGTALQPPTTGSSRSSSLAIYRLDFLLTARARPLAVSSAKVVIACRSGLIKNWVGPATTQPR